MGLRGTISGGLCLFGALGVAHPAFARDEGGLNASFSFAQGLTLEDDDIFGQTDLGFAINDSTKRETFAFSVDAQLLQRFDDGASLELGDPTAALQYSIGNRQSQLSTSLNYRVTDADALTQNANGLPNTLVVAPGEREDLSANFVLDFGQEAKFGGTIALGYAETTYSDTQSADLVDNTVVDGSIDLRFQIDKRITATLGYSLSETERVGQQDTRIERVTVGVDLAITPTLTASTSIGQSRVRTTNDTTNTKERGLNYSLNLTENRPNGAYTFDISSDISENGRRTSAQIGRSIDTKRGRLSGRVGVTEGADNVLRPLYQVTYQEELPRGAYNINFDQALSVNTLGEETLNSRLRLGWQHALTRQSDLQTDVAWQRTNVIGSSDDSGRIDLNLNYSQSLSEDWTFFARARHSWLETNGSGNDQQNELSVGLQTAFKWRS